MTDRNADHPRPLFSALLTPHRSLGRTGFRVLIGAVGLICLVIGIVFWRIGAWPVVGFAGLDVALVWLAFRTNYRSARAYEEVQITAHEVMVRKVSQHGQIREYRANPVWTRLAIDRLDDEGVVRIALQSRGQSIDIGGFLNPDDRSSFADALRAALNAAKSGAPVEA